MRFYGIFTKSAHPSLTAQEKPMAKNERRSGRGRRLRERRSAGGAAAAQEKKGAAARRRLTLERRSGLDRRSMGALDAILRTQDD
jgi:hypothetical protein